MHHAAADDHRRDVDLGVDLGAVADDERVVALDLTLEHAVHADAAFEVELPFESGSATEECRDFRGGQGVHEGGRHSFAADPWQQGVGCSILRP